MIPQVALGQTGLTVSRLGFGTGTTGWNGRSRQTELGHDELVRLLRLAYDLGVTFWDTADQYGSHPHVRDALSGLDRARVTVLTKTIAQDQATMTKAIPRFLRELGTDYVDIVLLHCMHSADWPARYQGTMTALTKAKEKGLVRAVGVSCHDLGALRTAAREPWCETILARINPDGQRMDGPPPQIVPVLEEAHAAGKGVVAMKVLAEGDLRAERRRSLDFVGGLSPVDAIVLGIESEQELREDVALLAASTAPAQSCQTQLD